MSTLLGEPNRIPGPGADRPPVLVAAGYPEGQRTRPGARLDQEFEELVDWLAAYESPDLLAVEDGDIDLT
ncbi:MAG: hypothetical protein QOE32_1195, partial [Pseudonocardiales bacterium]|nr:hypothetical protein [Pseudonocardiales bacterium]